MFCFRSWVLKLTSPFIIYTDATQTSSRINTYSLYTDDTIRPLLYNARFEVISGRTEVAVILNDVTRGVWVWWRQEIPQSGVTNSGRVPFTAHNFKCKLPCCNEWIISVVLGQFWRNLHQLRNYVRYTCVAFSISFRLKLQITIQAKILVYCCTVLGITCACEFT